MIPSPYVCPTESYDMSRYKGHYGSISHVLPSYVFSRTPIITRFLQSPVTYTIHPDTESEARGYFYIVPSTGELILARPLSDSNKTEFRVCNQ